MISWPRQAGLFFYIFIFSSELLENVCGELKNIPKEKEQMLVLRM